MNALGWIQLLVFLVLLLAAAWPLAAWITKVMDGRFALGRRLEAPLLRAAGVPADAGQGWLPYLLGLLVMVGLLGTFLGLFETLRGAREALGASGDVAALRPRAERMVLFNSPLPYVKGQMDGIVTRAQIDRPGECNISTGEALLAEM